MRDVHIASMEKVKTFRDVGDRNIRKSQDWHVTEWGSFSRSGTILMFHVFVISKALVHHQGTQLFCLVELPYSG